MIPYVLKEHVALIFKGQWPMDKLFWDHLPFQTKDTHSFEMLGTTHAALLCHIPQVWDLDYATVKTSKLLWYLGIDIFKEHNAPMYRVNQSKEIAARP
jgi:hypothetical protein